MHVQQLMVRLKNKSGLVLGLSAALCLPLVAQTNAPKAIATPAPAAAPKTTATATPATPHKTHSHSKPKPAPVAEAPQTPPPPPPTLEQTPPTAPEVSYRGGQLAINAINSTLSQVLRSVQTQTGALVEMPASASNERVVAQLGPGRPHDVINTLLNGSKFDYVILGVAGNPGAVQKVILSTPKAASSAVKPAAGNSPSAPAQAAEEEPQDEAAEAEPEPTPAPASPNFRRPPMMPPGRMPEANQQVPGNGDPQNGARTPEELLQEMQQMQQQQQQMQEQLNPANRAPQ